MSTMGAMTGMTTIGVDIPPTSPPSREVAVELVEGWLALWNGDLSQAEGVLAPDFRTHAAVTGGGDGSEINGAQGLADWVANTRLAMPDLLFTVQVGPIIQGDQVALRWRARGTYAGGIPGAAAPAGTGIDFTGTDVLLIADGRLSEYWVNSDTLLMLSQLQALG